MDHPDHPKVTRARMALCTLNNPKVDPQEYLEAWSKLEDVVYVTGQLEKGENGTPHIQYFVQTKEKHRPQFYKDHCKHSHFKLVTNNNGADRYCMKEATRVEGPWTFGVRPARLNKKGDLARRNKELREKGAEQAVIDGDIPMKDYPKVKNALDEFDNNTHVPEHLTCSDLREVNYWVYGPPGSGKTSWALKEFPDLYEKDKSKYWNGYRNQAAVLIDDIEEDEKFMLGNLKKWCNQKPFMLENKYGVMRNIRPKHIIVTSNYTIEEIWTKSKEREALLRRFTIIPKL